MALNKNKVIAAAQRYTQKGQLNRAIKEYRTIVNEDPDDIRIWLKIGDLYARKGSLVQAITTYKKVAHYYKDSGFFLKAVAVYKQIVNIDRNNIDAHLGLGNLYAQLGLIPDSISRLQYVVGAYEREGKYSDSLELLKKIVSLSPDDEVNQIRLAEAYARQGDIESAVVSFKSVLGQLYAKERYDDFIQVSERLLFLSSEEFDTIKLLSEVYLKKGDAKRALARLQLLFRINPKDIETLKLLASAFKEMGLEAKAIAIYRELARIFFERNDEVATRESWLQLLQIDPEDAEALEAVGEADASSEFPSSSPQSLVSSKVGLSADEKLLKYIEDVKIYRKYLLFDHALGRIQKIFEINPKFEDAFIQKKAIAHERDDKELAVSTLFELAEIYQESEPEKAIVFVKEILELHPNHAEAKRKIDSLLSLRNANTERTNVPVEKGDSNQTDANHSVKQDQIKEDEFTALLALGSTDKEDEFADLMVGTQEPLPDKDEFADLMLGTQEPLPDKDEFAD